MVLGRDTQSQHDSFKRLAVLTLASLLLCLSMIMSIFTSFPVALATVIYGRAKGYSAMVIAWIASFVISFFILRNPIMFATYTCSIIVTVIGAELVLRNVRPIKGILVGGSLIVALVAGLFFATFNSIEMSPKEYLSQEIQKNKGQFEKELKDKPTDDAFKMLAMLQKPEKMAEDIIKEAPGYLLIGSFLIVWANLFLLLKSKRTMLGAKLPYTDYDLLHFKNPDFLIWGVIAALTLTVFGEDFHSNAPAIGMTMLMGLGVFYFFQGFGLYLSFLNFLRIGGFLRTILVILTVMMAAQVLALFGLFDMFVNFRKFMKRKDQGE